MSTLPRLCPDPIPAIHPLPEHRAEGERARWYADMKAALQVPWMGVVTMAYAHYPAFFRELWRGLEPLCASRPFVEHAMALRAFAERQAVALGPLPISGRLGRLGYGGREIGEIRDVVEVFSHGNHLYALIATIARLLMEGGDMTGSGDAPPFGERHAPDVDVRLVLMEAHHADAPTGAVYDDIKTTLGLPFVNTDYRALARWPSYWAMAWRDLGPVVGLPAHEALCLGYHNRLAAAAAETLPNPGGLTSGALCDAAARDAPVDEVIAMCRLFQWLLPGLATNVAFLRAELVES